MTNSTTAPKSRKRRKSKEKFPLTLRKSDNRWCKKVLGKIHYFGNAKDDPEGEAALKLWRWQEPYLTTGKVPPPMPGEAAPGVVTVDEVCNKFLIFKRNAVRSGELSERTYHAYTRTAKLVIETFGRTRAAADLRPADFELLREKITETRGLHATANEVQHARMIFKYGYDMELLDKPLRFGTFKRPTKKAFRIKRNNAGKKMFTAEEIRAMLANARQPLKSMILLGINCAFGNTDCSELPLDAIDADRGWHDYGRPKTGAERRCPLWPETVESLRKWLAKRPECDEQSVFVTKRRQRFVRLKDDVVIDGVAQEMGKLLRELGIKRRGVGFYTLRRTFRTIADETNEGPAIDYIMGHGDDPADMGAQYRQEISDARLQTVSDHVRAWLFPPEEKPQKSRKRKAEASA
jgi:integrase